MQIKFCTVFIIAISISLNCDHSAIAAPESSEPKPILTVGAVDDSLPCSEKIDGAFKGLPIEIWRHIAEKNRLNYQYKSIATYDEAIKLASKGIIDLTVSCHSITPSRMQLVDFSVPFQRSSILLVSRNINFIGLRFFLKVIRNEIVWKCGIFLILVTTISSIGISKGGFDLNKISRNWMYLMLGAHAPIINDTKRNYPFIILAGLSRTAFLSLIIGTVASLIYTDSKPSDSRIIERKYLQNVLSEGVIVIDGTISKAWLIDLMKRSNIDSELLQPIVVNSNREKGNYLKSNRAAHFVDDSLAYRSVLENAGLVGEFSPTIRSMNVYPQGFAFSPGLPKDIRRVINIEIAKMFHSGMLTEMIDYWDYESPYIKKL